MKLHSILYSVLMAQAIVDGRKSQTRRIIKPQPIDDTINSGYVFSGDHKNSFKNDILHPDWRLAFAKLSPYGQPGDVLRVKEPHRITCDLNQPSNGLVWVEYCTRAGEYDLLQTQIFNRNQIHPDTLTKLKARKSGPKRWVQGRYLPNDLVRLFLETTGSRVERLQDISEADAVAEGVIQNPDGSWHDYLEPDKLWQDTAVASFISLWLKINGPESWSNNPFVWVQEFKRINKPLS